MINRTGSRRADRRREPVPGVAGERPHPATARPARRTTAAVVLPQRATLAYPFRGGCCHRPASRSSPARTWRGSAQAATMRRSSEGVATRVATEGVPRADRDPAGERLQPVSVVADLGWGARVRAPEHDPADPTVFATSIRPADHDRDRGYREGSQARTLRLMNRTSTWITRPQEPCGGR
jgi:hypothetical protein